MKKAAKHARTSTKGKGKARKTLPRKHKKARKMSASATAKAVQAAEQTEKKNTGTEQAQLLTPEQVKAITGFSRTKIYRMEVSGEMPQAIRFGHSTIRFRRAEIEAWIEGGCRPVRRKGA